MRPMKRRGNRRYYQHHEVLMIRRIRDLLYDQGFTISGARNKLHDIAQDETDTPGNEELASQAGKPVEDTNSAPPDFVDSSEFEDSQPLVASPYSHADQLAQQHLQLVRRELFEIRDLLSATH